MKRATVNGKYDLMLPDLQADWDYLKAYEVQRMDSMASNLKRGDVVYDVGSEHGTISAIIATMVGGENMHLFEPTPTFWPNIRLTFEQNNLQLPTMFVGFVSDVTDDRWIMDSFLGDWPPDADGNEVGAGPYRNVREPGELSRVRLDDWAVIMGNPDVMTIDVEGAELLVLKGAENLLQTVRPLIYLSVHDEYLRRDYDTDPQAVLDYLHTYGYETRFLGEDHERHFVCWHPKGRQVV